MISARALAEFEAALDRPAAARLAHVRDVLADDPDCLAEVEALLAAHQRSAAFLQPESAQRVVGAYRLLRLLGSGGMGAVYLAERSDGAFEQRVAIKLLSSSLADPDSIRRAEAERRFLAWLEHPHIARILDGGSTAEGQPYVVMEYVDGEQIDRHCRAERLGLRARITLFLDVLAAVDAAHRALIVHRDIKPANVMVSRDGQVKLLDFGIAKSLDGRIRGTATIGERGPLTPDYASPEQLAGEPLTTACDVYSLGLLLHELLTGVSAHGSRGRSLQEIARAAMSPPDTLASGRVDAAGLGLDDRTARIWRRQLSGDLDRVLLKALQPRPVDRYGSAREFADDLRCWLDGRVVQARAGGTLYRLRRFVGRNRLAVTAGTAVVLALTIGLGVAAYQGQRAHAQADRAERAKDFLLDLIGNADLLVSGRMPTLGDAIDRAVPGIAERFGGQPQSEGAVRLALGRVYLSLESLDAAAGQLRAAEVLLRPFGGAEYADCQMQLGILDWWNGHYAEAERRMLDAIDRFQRMPADPTQQVGALNSYGALLNDLGRFQEAVASVERSQQLIDAGARIEGRDRAGMFSNLGFARHGLGQLDLAIAAHAAALAEFERVLPAIHPDIAVSLNNLAMALQDAGRHEQALGLFRRSLEIRRQFAGADGSLTVKAQTNLAVILADGGQHQEAQALIAEAQAHAAAAFGPDQVSLANTHAAAARVALASGDAATAIAQANTALSIYAKLEKIDPAYPERARTTLDKARGLAAAAPVPVPAPE
ncbi:MAG: protein kinase [Lysobacterales bacterium]